MLRLAYLLRLIRLNVAYLEMVEVTTALLLSFYLFSLLFFGLRVSNLTFGSFYRAGPACGQCLTSTAYTRRHPGPTTPATTSSPSTLSTSATTTVSCEVFSTVQIERKLEPYQSIRIE